MTTADLTNRILVAIPAAFPHRARVWRRSVGGAVPIATVKQACGLIRVGSYQSAISVLQRQPLRFGVPGEPDIDGWIVIRGLACRLGVEIKSATDRMRPEQKVYRDLLESMGGIYIEARDVDGCIADLRRRVAEREAQGV